MSDRSITDDEITEMVKRGAEKEKQLELKTDQRIGRKWLNTISPELRRVVELVIAYIRVQGNNVPWLYFVHHLKTLISNLEIEMGINDNYLCDAFIFIDKEEVFYYALLNNKGTLKIYGESIIGSFQYNGEDYPAKVLDELEKKYKYETYLDLLLPKIEDRKLLVNIIYYCLKTDHNIFNSLSELESYVSEFVGLETYIHVEENCNITLSVKSVSNPEVLMSFKVSKDEKTINYYSHSKCATLSYNCEIKINKGQTKEYIIQQLTRKGRIVKSAAKK